MSTGAGRVRHPRTWLLHGARPFANWLFRRRMQVQVHGADFVPTEGPVILAANHMGVLDGPLLAIFAPRPVHALTKQEMFSGPAGVFFRQAGQIKLDRFHADPGAVRTCLAVLEQGAVVGIFPEGTRGAGEFTEGFHRGAAYLGLVSGAPIVPVTILGSRPPGGGSSALPDPDVPVHLVFGPARTLPRTPWPRTKEQVGVETVLLRDYLRSELDRALRLTGATLPGPLPAQPTQDDREPDAGPAARGA